MGYVDGFVAAVPKANKLAYLEFARALNRSFLDHGAISVTDCWGDDVPEGKLTSLPMAVKRGEDEAVLLRWIVWPSKPMRDQGWEQVMKDPRTVEMSPTLFDVQRMIFGGFDVISSMTREA